MSAVMNHPPMLGEEKLQRFDIDVITDRYIGLC